MNERKRKHKIVNISYEQDTVIYYQAEYLGLFFWGFFFIFYNDFYFFLHEAGLQCSVNFLLHSKVTQSHIHVYILFSHIIMLHHKRLDIVPSAVQQDLIAYPFQRQQFASICKTKQNVFYFRKKGRCTDITSVWHLGMCLFFSECQILDQRK